MKLVLASQSLGRKKILDSLKIPYEITPSNIDEDSIIAGNPLETIKLRAKMKGEEVGNRIKNQEVRIKENKNILLLSADSGAILDNNLIGKPKDYQDGLRIFKILSGKTHEFVTAVYLMNNSDIFQDYTTSYVTFRKLSEWDIKRYLNVTPYTRYAAGYATSTQDFITRIEGSITNVIGLPLEIIIPIFRKNGLIKI